MGDDDGVSALAARVAVVGRAWASEAETGGGGPRPAAWPALPEA